MLIPTFIKSFSLSLKSSIYGWNIFLLFLLSLTPKKSNLNLWKIYFLISPLLHSFFSSPSTFFENKSNRNQNTLNPIEFHWRFLFIFLWHFYRWTNRIYLEKKCTDAVDKECFVKRLYNMHLWIFLCSDSFSFLIFGVFLVEI